MQQLVLTLIGLTALISAQLFAAAGVDDPDLNIPDRPAHRGRSGIVQWVKCDDRKLGSSIAGDPHQTSSTRNRLRYARDERSGAPNDKADRTQIVGF